MKIYFTELAKHELNDAVTFYESELPGLGKRFKDDVKKSSERLSRYPEAWSVERGEIRKCLLHRFPYKLLYSIEPDHILIIAVSHQHRKPEYWADRL